MQIDILIQQIYLARHIQTGHLVCADILDVAVQIIYVDVDHVATPHVQIV